LMAEVRVSIGGQQITSIITARSAREMQLKRGQTAAALIKATDVMILRLDSWRIDPLHTCYRRWRNAGTSK